MHGFTGILSEDILTYWPTISALIEPALLRDKPPSWTLEELLADLQNRELQAWVGHQNGIIEYVIITMIIEDTCWIVYSGGKDLVTYFPVIHVIECWAKSHNCKKLAMQVRKGFYRVFKRYSYIYQKAIVDGNKVVIKELNV